MPGKILIVDDDADFREAMTTLLEARGYSIVTASDGEEGFSKAKEEKPDLILLDVMMANKTEGFDIARKIHGDEEIKDTPVLMTTGIRKDMNLSFGFEPDSEWLPVKGVLEKPIKPDVLLSEVEKNIKK
ncbi:MAG: response regulator [Candidatus Omnitrophica bacterium]|nr:response regulator [Candidatus Omnitrophota bacterium]